MHEWLSHYFGQGVLIISMNWTFKILNLVTILQVCDGIFDCPRSETSDDGEDEDDCYGGF